MPLTRDQIMAVQDIETVEVDVPAWDGSVLVRGMTAAERGKYMAAMMEQRGKHQIVRVQEAQVRLCAMCMVDAEGKRLFGDGDVPALASKAAAALQPVYEAAARLSGLSDEDVAELTKNSDGQSDGSPSD